ncbi:YqjF family protein [Flavimarina sp. Hel_I_48]|uniref:YqjF family protein n=1 Tax=Flavimarina sp. Hel_I_48 TaxID=1392488 RepID=UPI0004DEE210|nr:DUF2071 domain-containing protein [Flavimarina sp. Hel_I_48]
MSFLTAEWRKLCFANYQIDPEILKPYVPLGTELDFFEGKCYVSLVGFLFDKVKLKGISVPFHTRFEEINLRFYVTRMIDGKKRRGTVFISEIVAKPAIVLVANLLYNEKYSLKKMHYNHHITTTENTISYALKNRGKWQQIALTTENISKPFESGSKTEFITEHYWGYSKKDENKTVEYEVRHPQWEAYEVINHSIEIDFGQLYGKAFSSLSKQIPDSLQCMEGSPISIEGKKLI